MVLPSGLLLCCVGVTSTATLFDVLFALGHAVFFVYSMRECRREVMERDGHDFAGMD
jgi:hypothetical protein